MAYIELTLAEISEPILISLEAIVLVEQKPLHAGGHVTITLENGKEFGVIETYNDVKDAVFRATSGENVSIGTSKLKEFFPDRK